MSVPAGTAPKHHDAWCLSLAITTKNVTLPCNCSVASDVSAAPEGRSPDGPEGLRDDAQARAAKFHETQGGLVMARFVTFKAKREPMFCDEAGNGWVPIARFNEVEDENARLVADLEAAERKGARLYSALEELLDVAERMRGGDPKLDPEAWYAIRDFARLELKETAAALEARVDS